jgi:hypothetical protein
LGALDTIADRQALWSVTANNLKAQVGTARWTVLGFSVLGALLAALASQLGRPTAQTGTAALAGDPRTWIAIAGAASLVIATFVTQRRLGQDRVTGWVRARAIAEALKREAYKFAAGAAPYDKPDADPILLAERQKIEADGDDLLGSLVGQAGKGSVPRSRLTPEEYVQKRVDPQIRFYSENADKYKRSASALRSVEFYLALAATVITALASVSGNNLFGAHFDLAALTAVLTTVAGAILAQVEASRYDYLVTTYRASARRLVDRKGGALAPVSDFVNDCENIIATENTSWIAKWSKPTTAP